MIDGKRVVALVPMKGESERVPGKNMRPFAGRPLFAHVLRALAGVSAIDEIAVDTDSEALASMVVSELPAARIIERPKHLIGHTVPMNDIICYDLEQTEGDLYLQTHSTNPLLRSETIERALKAMAANMGDCDSLFSVTPVHARFWTRDGTPINHDPSVLLRTQDLEPIYEENSNIYVFPRTTPGETGRRIGARPMIFPMDRAEALDIDEELDFEIAEFMFQKRNRS